MVRGDEPGSGPDDADVVLTVRYANMAALDNLDDRGDAISKSVLNYTPEQAIAASVQRGQMRRHGGEPVVTRARLRICSSTAPSA